MLTDEERRAAYPDLIDSETDPAGHAVIAALHRRYTAPEPPAALLDAVENAVLEFERRAMTHHTGADERTAETTRALSVADLNAVPTVVQARPSDRLPFGLPPRVPRRLLAAAVLLLAATVMAVATQPAGAGAVGEGLKAWLQAAVGVQVQRNPEVPISVTPSPPFALYQPTWLPADLSRRGVSYNPANVDPATGRGHAYPANSGQIDYARLGLRFNPGDAFFVLHDADEHQGGPELILLERRAVPGEQLPVGPAADVLGQRGTLAPSAGGHLLSTVVNGTWLQLWTNLSQADVTRVVQSLRLTDRGVGALVPQPGPTVAPAPTAIPDSFPAVQRPTYLPPSLDGSLGTSYYAIPPGAQGRVMPPFAGGDAPVPAPAVAATRTPLLQQLAPQLRWAEQAWAAIGGGVFGVTFGGPDPLAYLQIGPVHLDGDPAGTPVATPAGRTVWMIAPAAGASFHAHWTNGSPLDFQQVFLAHSPSPADARIVLWVHGDAIVWLRSTLPQRELLRFIDGLMATK